MDILSSCIAPALVTASNPPPESHTSPTYQHVSIEILIEWLSDDAFFDIPSNSIYRDTLKSTTRTEMTLLVINGVRGVLNNFKERAPPEEKDARVTASSSKNNLTSAKAEVSMSAGGGASASTTSVTSFDDQFPTLNNTKPNSEPHQPSEKPSVQQSLSANPNKKPGKQKQKKRIRPQSLSQTSEVSNGSFGSVIQSPAFGLKASTDTDTASLSSMMSAFDESFIKSSEKHRPPLSSFPGVSGGKNLFDSEFSKVSIGSNEPPQVLLKESYSNPRPSQARNNQLPPPSPPAPSPPTQLSCALQQPAPKITQVEKLAKIYSALVMNKFAPSTSTEVILLLKLISMPDNFYPSTNSTYIGNDNEDGIDSTVIVSTLDSAKACNLFAANSFKLLLPIVNNLFNDTLKTMLVNCKSLQTHSPQVCKQINAVISTNNSFQQSVNEDIKSTTAAFYSRPFNDQTDSRNHFRSQEHARLFSNREGTRDVFMSQLRNFQDLKSMIDDTNLHQYNENLKRNIANMLSNLDAHNVVWFVEFFCDMLLQIGAVSSFKETDEEVLSNSKDKDRIQKLHMRFSTKTTSSSVNATAHPQGHKSSTTTNQIANNTPQHFFPDNQKFFFLFVRMCDSYQFIVQLSRNLCGQIQKLTSINTSHTGATGRILKLKLLAKFLGLIVFSPNWDLDAHVFSQQQQHTSLSDFSSGSCSFTSTALQQHKKNEALLLSTKNSINSMNATSPILPIFDLICDSYETDNLTMTISWVVEYLRMSKWDFVSKFSRYYQRCFSLLLTLNKKSQKLKFNSPGFNSNLMFVSLEIDALLCDVMSYKDREKLFYVDLSDRTVTSTSILSDHQTTKKPRAIQAIQSAKTTQAIQPTQTVNESLDDTLLFSSKTHLLSSSPFFIDIQNALINIKRNESSSANLSTRKRRMTGKKMRPLSISFDNARKDSNASLSSIGNNMNDSVRFGSFPNLPNLDESFSSEVSSTPLKSTEIAIHNKSASKKETPQHHEITLIEGGSAAKTLNSPSPRSRPFSPVLARSLTPTKIQKSLVDAFFHQHPKLQNIAEIGVEIIVKDVSAIICDSHVKTCVFEEAKRMGEGVDIINPSGSQFDLGRHSVFLDNIERMMERTTSLVMVHECQNRLDKTFLGLAPANTNSAVLRLAIDLSRQHAVNEGCRLVGQVVRSEAKKKLDHFFSERKKSTKSSNDDTSKKCNSSREGIPPIEQLHNQLLSVIDANDQNKTDTFVNYVFNKRNFTVIAELNAGKPEFSAILNFVRERGIISAANLSSMGRAIGADLQKLNID